MLDTSIIQRMLTYGEFLYDGHMDEEEAKRRAKRHGVHELHEMDSLRVIIRVMQRGSLPVAIAEWSVEEQLRSGDMDKADWVLQLYYRWKETEHDLEIDRRRVVRRAALLLDAGRLSFLPDDGDRRIVAEALALGCDTLISMDRKTILRHHIKLHEMGLDAVSPAQFVEKNWDRLAGA